MPGKIINFKNLQATEPNRYKIETEGGGTSYAKLTRESTGETQAPTPLNAENLKALQNNCVFKVEAVRSLEGNVEFYDIQITDSDTYDLIDYQLIINFDVTNTTQAPRIRLNGNSYPLISTDLTSFIAGNIEANKPYIAYINQSQSKCLLDINISEKKILGYSNKYNLTGSGSTLNVDSNTIAFDKNGTAYLYVGSSSTWQDNNGGLPDSEWTENVLSDKMCDLMVGVVYHKATQTLGYRELKANGAAVSRTAYAKLFAKIGTIFGAGDGVNTFNLPDLRGEFVRGWDDGRGVDLNRQFGSYQADGVGPHEHKLIAGTGDPDDRLGGSTASYGIGIGSPLTHVTAMNNGATAVETRPRNIALMAIIKY